MTRISGRRGESSTLNLLSHKELCRTVRAYFDEVANPLSCLFRKGEGMAVNLESPFICKRNVTSLSKSATSSALCSPVLFRDL